MTRSDIDKEFSKGDLRGKGGVDKVLEEYQNDPSIRKHIFDMLFGEERLVVMRAADAYEQIAKESGVKDEERVKLLRVLDFPKEKEFMWHYVQVLGYMDIPKDMKEKVFNYLKEAIDKYLDSNIVRVFSMQSLFDLFGSDMKYKNEVKKIIERMSKSNIKSIKSRANKLIKVYNN